MDIYYKYSGMMDLNFFKRPTIKLSVPYFLNDPFESQPSKNIIKAIENTTKSPCPDGVLEHIKNMIECNGIVSLSETQRNSLMWAHYGEHHKGMCIGFSPDFINEINLDIDDREKDFQYYCMAILKPEKVNYDNHRFDTNKLFKPGDLVYEAFKRHFYTKSDEWIYEKEHRSIVPYAYSTHLLIKNENEIIHKEHDGEVYDILLKNVKDSLIKMNAIREADVEGLYEINGAKISLVMLSNLAYFQSITFLQEISPTSINEIYFGCKSDIKTVRDIYNEIKSEHHPLKHVKMYRLSTSKERFELQQEELSDEYFTMITAE
ncbi:DUF2971 domain-containing protein [Aeromonas veronii]|uniref:DUF2971 domain-containing protein n=1 Tax=Aeromonas veronii TaxID=654 RepID=UPI003D21277B